MTTNLWRMRIQFQTGASSASRPGNTGVFRVIRWLLAGLLLTGVAGCESRHDPQVAMAPQTGSLKAEFVGAKACKSCHEEVFNGWLATFHAYKFQAVSPGFVKGDFTRNNTLTQEDGQAKMTREGDQFFITTSSSNKGDGSTYPVNYVVGSAWKQRYITRLDNGVLGVLPVQWNVRSQEWVGYRALGGAGDQTDAWKAEENAFQYRCMGCHTTNGQVTRTEAGHLETSWGDTGVACESCHGPGGMHIRAEVRDKAGSIINPAKLADPERAAAICGSCHTRGSSQDGRFSYPVDYQPGDVLRFQFDEAPGVYPDGSPKAHHQQFNDWQASGHARGGVMCWDCHAPHATGKSNRFQLKLPGSLLCSTCHQVSNSGVHGMHSVNNCMGCHMPSTVQSATPGDLRSHRFTVVRPSLTVESGGVEAQPNSCNLCHYHRDTDPERLVHFMNAAKKPQFCKSCHYHVEQDPEDEED